MAGCEVANVLTGKPAIGYSDMRMIKARKGKYESTKTTIYAKCK